jgi:hypothetical protein
MNGRSVKKEAVTKSSTPGFEEGGRHWDFWEEDKDAEDMAYTPSTGKSISVSGSIVAPRAFSTRGIKGSVKTFNRSSQNKWNVADDPKARSQYPV